MRFLLTRRTTARLFFIIGLVFMLLGCVFLVGSIFSVSTGFLLLVVFFMALGIGCAALAIKLKKSALYLFFAAYSLQVGLFLLLSRLNIIPITFARVWPLLSVFTGIALFPAGWYRYGVIRIRYVVPSLAFIILGSVLLVFSLDLVTFSFSQFVKDWWPLLLVLWGLIFLLVSMGTKNTENIER